MNVRTNAGWRPESCSRIASATSRALKPGRSSPALGAGTFGKTASTACSVSWASTSRLLTSARRAASRTGRRGCSSLE
jgi:hypothetical protein